jgi:hypothetical protein
MYSRIVIYVFATHMYVEKDMELNTRCVYILYQSSHILHTHYGTL